MNCRICSKPITLVPSAAERACKFGGVASDYTNLFTTHNECELRKRTEDTTELVQRHRARYEELTHQGFYAFTHP